MTTGKSLDQRARSLVADEYDELQLAGTAQSVRDGHKYSVHDPLLRPIERLLADQDRLVEVIQRLLEWNFDSDQADARALITRIKAEGR